MENGNESPSPLIPAALQERLKSPKAIGTIVLVAFLLFSRLWDLGLKPVQHDESMFAYYSWLIYEKTEADKHPGASLAKLETWKSALGGYDYLPIMHGPFLEYITAGVFLVFGDSDYTMRLGCAICGLLIFLSLFYLRKDIGEGRAWLAIILIGICPTFTFVTRYIRPDMYVIVMYIWAIHAGWRYATTLRPWRLAVFLLVGWMASMTHETYVIFYFFMITFGVGCWIHGCVHPEKYEDENFLPKGGGRIALPVPAKYTIFALIYIPLLIWLGWLLGKVPSGGGEAKYGLAVIIGLGVFVVGEACAFTIRRFQARKPQPFFVRMVFPAKAIPFYRELRYAFTYHWPVIVLSSMVGLFITVAFHTSFYHFMQHTWGQVEAFKYWLNEHEGHRIKGEFHFHLIHLMIYEMPLLILFVICCVKQMWAVEPSPWRNVRRILFWVWLVGSLLILEIPASWTPVEGDVLWNSALDPKWYERLHMTLGIHLWIFVQCLLVVFITGWIHLNKKRIFHAMCDYWFIGSFLAYNYAGEKVPWVGAHIVLPMMLSCTCYIWMIYQKYFAQADVPALEAAPAAPQAASSKAKDSVKRKAKNEPATQSLSFWALIVRGTDGIGRLPRLLMSKHFLTFLAVASFGWTMYVWTLLCFVQPGSPIERHTYASSHTEFHAMVHEVIDECMDRYSGYDTPIMFGGEPGWPLNWIMRDFRNRLVFSASADPKDMYKGTYTPNTPRLMMNISQPPGSPQAEPVFVIMDSVMVEYWKPEPRFKPRYAWVEVPFRHYWVPEKLKWEKMKKLGLLFRSEESLKDEPEKLADRKTCIKEWRKLLIAYFLRDEERTKNGEPDEWLSLGGMDSYFGRLRSDLPPVPAAK